MSTINTTELRNTAIMRIFSEKDLINLAPEYQRQGGVWSLAKKQLLMDSILNNYDIPKIYFHEIDAKDASNVLYAVIDGRQRLQAIFEFLNDEFKLSDDFEYQKNSEFKLASLTYSEMAIEYPKIRILFDSYVLPIMLIQTDDLELIEDMFSRLNEAVPLNAAEKRNAISGKATTAIRDLVNHEFFKEKIKISNSRYQHLEIAARFLMIEEKIAFKHIIDTSKSFLDDFVEKNKGSIQVDEYFNNALTTLDAMLYIFHTQDALLKRQGDMAIYYLLFRDAKSIGLLSNITRNAILEFQEKVSQSANQDTWNNDEDYKFRTYFMSSQQGTNNFTNIKARYGIIASFFGIHSTNSSLKYILDKSW